MEFLLIGALLLADGERLACTADTSIAMHPGEEANNHGGRPAMRLKGLENFVLLAFDPAPIKGRTVEEARLFLKPAGEHKLKALGVSSVSSPWTEGTGSGNAPEPGAACFLEAERGKRAWAGPGSDFHSVSFGHGGSIWAVREARDEAGGWISVDLPPALLHALVEGNSFGIALSDEKGQTMANNNVYGREQSGAGPYVVVARSRAGAPPPSGARPGPKAPVAPADRGGEIVPKYQKPASPAPARLADGCEWRILYEGQTDGPAAGRIWDGRSISLTSARGEHVGFVVAVQVPPGQSRALAVGGDGWAASRILPVGAAFDPLVPVGGEVTGRGLFHVERYVEKSAPAGQRRLALRLSTGRAEVEIPVSLRVHGSTLPDALGFRVSLNAYSSPGGGDLALERAFHRLAHEHRATLAVVPYSHRGNVEAGFAPEIRRVGDRVEISSWDAWDGRWGPYFDGSAFKGLPREGAPLDHFYLPIHEQWPLPINEFYSYTGTAEEHWRDAPPVEKAFPEEYARGLSGFARETARHVAAKRWPTDFHIFLNNKNYIRFQRGEREGAWWCLDEPWSSDDFLALRWYGALFREGTRDVAGARVRFRIDLSRPQWRRERLDGLIDLCVVNGLYRAYPQFVFGRGEEVWVYGGLSAPGGPGEEARGWILQSFLDGADGVLPWLAIGTEKAWSEPEDTAIVLPPGKGRERRPYATARLKMLRRGQQDAEILKMLLARRRISREEARRGVAEFLGLSGRFRQSSAEEAGSVDFGALDPDRFEALRQAALAALDRP